MKKSLFLNAFLAFALILSPLLEAGNPTPNQINKIFAKWDKPTSPGVLLMVIRNGAIVYKRGYGSANIAQQIPLKTDLSIGDLASTSKQFTAFCIAILIESGKLSLEDDVRTFFPIIPKYPQGIVRIKHLIHHLSGFQDYIDFMYERTGKTEYDYYTFLEVMTQFVKIKNLTFRPGAKFNYCNTNYLLLGKIIEKVTGKSLRQFAKENIFTPLKMNKTFFHTSNQDIIPNLALGYRRAADGSFKRDQSKLVLVGDGNLYTAIEDLYNWDQNFYKNILGKGGQTLINLTLKRGQLNDGRFIKYAFGLDVEQYRGLRMISHDGNFVGYTSALIRFPDQKFTVVIMSNLSTNDPFDLALRVSELYLDDLMK